MQLNDSLDYPTPAPANAGATFFMLAINRYKSKILSGISIRLSRKLNRITWRTRVRRKGKRMWLQLLAIVIIFLRLFIHQQKKQRCNSSAD